MAYVIKNTIKRQTYSDYPLHATPDDEMIIRMLCLPSDKNNMHNKHAPSVTLLMPEHEIDNRNVNDILDQSCRVTDLYPYVKQYKSKSDGIGIFYTIHTRWLGSNHVKITASEAEMDLQMLTYDGEKKVWTWKKY